MDLDDLLESIELGGKAGPRTGAVFRILFGLVGLFLSGAGIYHLLNYDAGLAFRLAGATLFFFLGCFCLFNVVLLRPWKWPGWLLLLSFAGLFVVRIVFGA